MPGWLAADECLEEGECLKPEGGTIQPIPLWLAANTLLAANTSLANTRRPSLAANFLPTHIPLLISQVILNDDADDARTEN